MDNPNRFNILLGPLTDETKAIAEKELRETPERVQEAIRDLRKMLKGVDDLFYEDDDAFLVMFLRPCKYYPDSAMTLMRKLAEFRRKQWSQIGNIMPADEQSGFTDGNVVSMFPERDQHGRRVFVVNTGGNWDPSKVTADQTFRIYYLLHLAVMLEPETQVRGVVVIMDFAGLSLRQVTALSPSFAIRILAFIQEAMPLRLSRIHVVKEPAIFKLVWALFKPLLKEKFRRRISFHGDNMASLHKHISATHLPRDYDGDLPAIDYTGKDWYPTIVKHGDFIAKWNACGFVNK